MLRIILLFIVSVFSSIRAEGTGFDIATAVSLGQIALPLGMAFVAGILTSFSPCVYPLIPITLTVIGAKTYRRPLYGFFVALTYVFGMTLVYASLGVVFAYVGVLMGALMQNSFVLLGIASIFALMGLSMMGILDVALPESITSKISRIGGNGIKGAFLMGLVAGILAAPCTGPVLGFILTLIASHKNIELGIGLMVFFSLGLGLPFLLLGTFSSAIAHLPKSGQWMNKIKIFMGLIMLCTAGYYVMLAWPKEDNLSALEPTPENFLVIDANTSDTATLSRLLQDAKQQKIPVIIDFYADWCQACKELEKYTFSDKKVMEHLKSVWLVRIDASKSSDYLIEIEDRFKITGLPTIVFIDKHGEIILDMRLLGFVPPKQFLQSLEILKASP